MEPIVIDQWTGRTVGLLQQAHRMTQEQFAHRLGVSVRALASWLSRPDFAPSKSMQQVLDTALEQTNDMVRARFAANFAPPLPAAPPVADNGNLLAEIEIMRARLELMQKELDYLSSKAQMTRH